ncbi:D-2-hydroxyacid dehydrogenase family protein [Derxia lacustris]|uniref:D-2-hydroxyacid dehydrogenase family protein n=1 Tax=Derxia lacustris TaxID=764842 RepID=UPI000A16F71D|nr:D-2-hydroxyacid dehydrogenase family protein [Derxia lacustris]
MNIAVLDDYQDAVRHLDCFKRLDGHTVKIFTNTVKGVGQLSVRLRDAEALVLIRERTRLNAAVLDKLPNLRVISQTGRVGRDPDSHLDIAACTARGIAVFEGQGDPTAAAELTWALVLAAQRRLPQYVGKLIHGAWQQSGLRGATMPPNHGLGRVLRGSTLGIWGYGRIGRLVAGYGRAFGMKVMVWGSDKSRAAAVSDGYLAAASRDSLFADSDVLSVHLRLVEATRGLIGHEDLQRMKPTALFVNTSRAELVEPDALLRSLNNGRPGFAALDVFESEPILQGHPLLRLENTICTPHIGYVERDSYERYFGEAFDNLLAYLANDSARMHPKLVNPEALTARQRS